MDENPKPVESTAVPTGVASAATVVGPNGPMPAELKGFNWGAFLLGWIWGVGHSVWIALVLLAVNFIPIIGTLFYFAGAIYLGVKGNELAWKNGHYASVEDFRKRERVWAIVGAVIFVLGILLVFGAVAAMINDNAPR